MIAFLIVLTTLMVVCGILSAIEEYMVHRELKRMTEEAWRKAEYEYRKNSH